MAPPPSRVSAPITPVHSPHHSVHSSTSLRTPLHTLSIHEYRKQQSTPVPRVATPSGKTLRRKASAFALNQIERLPSTNLSLRRNLHPETRPLQPSYSAHQLAPQGPPFGAQIDFDQLHRSQSAEPRAQVGSINSVKTADLHHKVGSFGTRKRLPRPLAATSSGPHSHPPSYAPVRPTRQIRATLPVPLSFLTEESSVSDTISTPTPSLSRFPQPPHFETFREAERERAISLAAIAPVTPPATPATIHYRGASFDLVNPHASLPYRDIVTPSRDFDSSELLPLRSSQETQSGLSEVGNLFSHHSCLELTNLQMAPKRPLYGNLNAAHAGIMRRTGDPPHSQMLDLPSPPTPVAMSPGSSTYTSPMYTPESRLAPSPLAVRKAPDDSRFSIKQLTRTLTKRLTKPSQYSKEEELQQFRRSNTSGLSINTDIEPLRPLEQTYFPPERASYFPISPVSPISPTSPASLHDFGSVLGEEDAVEYARKDSDHIYDSKELTSMVPDDPSTQVGRAGDPRVSVSSSDPGARPYYDDLASIYASSSVYTGDDYRKSAYQQSLAGTCRSNAFLRYSGMTAAGMANEYSYNEPANTDRPFSRPAMQELPRRSAVHCDGKIDTISKFIDQYDPENRATSLDSQPIKTASTTSLIEPYKKHHREQSPPAPSQPDGPSSGFSQFQFDIESTAQAGDDVDLDEQLRPSTTLRRALKYQAAVPPSAPPPLAPAFEYEGASTALPRPSSTEVFSNGSHASYGDTHNLLQLPQSEVDESRVAVHGLQPSSSYSQPDRKALEISSSYSQSEDPMNPQMPREALDEAELIFDRVTTRTRPSGDVPAIWGRESPVNLPRSKRLTDHSMRTVDNEMAEWETVGDDSQQGRMSLDSRDSIADYSSSDSTRNSLGLTAAASAPSWTKQNHTRGPSFYSHPSPVRAHDHPFSSSPPMLATRPGLHTAPDISAFGTSSSPPTSSTMPAFRHSNQPRFAVDEPYARAPWTAPYALSDKETQELLASGPNDDILFDDEDNNDPSRRLSYKFKNHEKVSHSSSPRSIVTDVSLERENTFDKLTIVGPKGNLTGTPRGTGMHDAGSSVADTSSPGAKLSSSVDPRGPRGPRSPYSDYDGFYASPFPAIGSVTRIRQTGSAPEHGHDRTPSEITLFPSAYATEPVQNSSPLAEPDGRRGLRCSTTFKPTRRASRTAVAGQTKLRQMVLAPDARSTVSSRETRFSRFMGAGGSERPSTSDTTTPLYPTHPSLDTFPTMRSGHTVVAQVHSPRLLCPERKASDKDEARRRKLSWLIFACFCMLPPCMFLYRMWGDTIIVSVTKGDLGHCTAKSKRAALIAGVVVNIGLVTAILVPILVAQALKAI
ncbi:hypothetical protein SVAN01_03529 [Stagonosporopsis vannaccii]|nr:hypothetical protein SVAN01_03529 [Stagonosporopsis vannaccii]